MAMQAQDTFVATLDNGVTEVQVTRGQVFPDSHELVKRDQAGAGVLFKPLDLGEEEASPKVPAPKPARPVRAAKS